MGESQYSPLGHSHTDLRKMASQRTISSRFGHHFLSAWIETSCGCGEKGDWADFIDMLPEYADKAHGEGFMHDTADARGALGWKDYRAEVEVVTPYFGSSGTGQINAVFPVM